MPCLLECKTSFFRKFGTSNMWGHLKFTYEALNRTKPNQIALNWTIWSQSKACMWMCWIICL